MNKDNVTLIYGFVAVRIFVLYLSSNISANIMNQIYTERVLINGEQPPKLVYQVYLFIFVDLILSLFLIAFVWGIINLTGRSNSNILNKFLTHHVITLIILIIALILLTQTMYEKKYFLYKDDGLRAIRALNEITFRIGTFICLLPTFMIIDDKIIDPISNISINTKNNSARVNNSNRNANSTI